MTNWRLGAGGTLVAQESKSPVEKVTVDLECDSAIGLYVARAEDTFHGHPRDEADDDATMTAAIPFYDISDWSVASFWTRGDRLEVHIPAHTDDLSGEEIPEHTRTFGLFDLISSDIDLGRNEDDLDSHVRVQFYEDAMKEYKDRAQYGFAPHTPRSEDFPNEFQYTKETAYSEVTPKPLSAWMDEITQAYMSGTLSVDSPVLKGSSWATTNGLDIPKEFMEPLTAEKLLAATESLKSLGILPRPRSFWPYDMPREYKPRSGLWMGNVICDFSSTEERILESMKERKDEHRQADNERLIPESNREDGLRKDIDFSAITAGLVGGKK